MTKLVLEAVLVIIPPNPVKIKRKTRRIIRERISERMAKKWKAGPEKLVSEILNMNYGAFMK